jgi:hypothetical protein
MIKPSISCSTPDEMLWYNANGDERGGWNSTDYGSAKEFGSNPPYFKIMDPSSTSYLGDTWVRHWGGYTYDECWPNG